MPRWRKWIDNELTAVPCPDGSAVADLGWKKKRGGKLERKIRSEDFRRWIRKTLVYCVAEKARDFVLPRARRNRVSADGNRHRDVLFVPCTMRKPGIDWRKSFAVYKRGSSRRGYINLSDITVVLGIAWYDSKSYSKRDQELVRLPS